VTLSKSNRLAAIVAIASLIVAACTPAASTQSPPETTGPANPTPVASAGPWTLPQPEKASLQVGLSVTEPSQYSGVLADQLGIYEKNGLNVEYSVFEGDARVAAALQAGQIDVGFSGTSSAISSQLTDVPYVVVAVNAVILTDDLACKGEIKTAEDVKGKSIAISTFGGTSNAAALLALKSLGLAATDAVITQVGGQSTRIAALQGGSIDCAIVDANLRDQMTAEGFSIVTKLKDAKIEFGRSGMSFTREFIDANPNTVLVTVASVLEAQNKIWTDPDAVAPLYAEFSQQDAETAKALILDFQEIGNRSMMATIEAFKNPQKTIAVINPDIIDVDLTTAFDMSFLETLRDNGYYEEIGNPVP
jgi:NitT/TauT family transport system substrate-binding protein